MARIRIGRDECKKLQPMQIYIQPTPVDVFGGTKM